MGKDLPGALGDVVLRDFVLGHGDRDTCDLNVEARRPLPRLFRLAGGFEHRRLPPSLGCHYGPSAVVRPGAQRRIRVNSSCASLASFGHKRRAASLEAPCTESYAGLVGHGTCVIEGRGRRRDSWAAPGNHTLMAIGNE